MYSDFATVEVEIRIADVTDRKFQFTYNRGIKISSFSPQYGYFDQAKALVIEGENFLPHAEINWKYTVGTEQILVATYLTNKTVSCDIPALNNSFVIPYYLVREFKFILYRMLNCHSTFKMTGQVQECSTPIAKRV